MTFEPPVPDDVPMLVNEVADLLRVSRRTVYHWLAAGKLSFFRTPSGTVRIWRSCLFRLAAVAGEPAAEPRRRAPAEPPGRLTTYGGDE